MNKPVKVLFVNGNIMKRGGIESFMMNYFRHIDHSKVHIDFLVHGFEQGIYDDEIIAAGSKVLHVPTKSKHPILYPKELKKIFLTREYQIVHSHCDAMNGWILKIAAECGVAVRIAHSHNTATLSNNIIKLAINDYVKGLIPKYATHLFACSEAAGKWMFGENLEFKVINNAIEVEKYMFDPSVREKVRGELNLHDDFVIGHVGRFDYQKNHEFLVRIIQYLNNVGKKDVKLICVGEGPLIDDIKKIVDNAGLEDRVLFLGSRSDVDLLYNAFDVFVLPSKFEGLPVVGIEAQCNGLQCFFADTVTDKVKILKETKLLPLDIDSWGTELSTDIPTRYLNAEEQIVKSGYDISVEAKKLQMFYIDVGLRR